MYQSNRCVNLAMCMRLRMLIQLEICHYIIAFDSCYKSSDKYIEQHCCDVFHIAISIHCFDCEAAASAFKTIENKQDVLCLFFISIVTKETTLVGVSEKQL